MMDYLIQITWQNPIFMLVAIGALWFIPGLIIRRIAERKYIAKKQRTQQTKIAKLYPKEIKK